MQFTTVAIFALFAGAMALPNAEANPRRRPHPSPNPAPSNPSPNPAPNPQPNPAPNPAPNPEPNPSPNPAPSPPSGGTRRINKGNAAQCIGALGGAGANCGTGIQQQVEAAAANGGDIASCVFDAISAIPECKGLTSSS